MILLLAPSKTQDFSSDLSVEGFSMPLFQDEAGELARKIKTWDLKRLMSEMKISEKLALATKEKYAAWEAGKRRPALLAFVGDVYRDVCVERYSAGDFAFAQKHLRIFSGLYGYLRALDLIAPYRLEMKGLASFWQEKVTAALQVDADADDGVVVNLASKEYADAVNFKALKAKLVTPIFRQRARGEEKIVPLYSKIARGTMANWIIRERITKPEELVRFNLDGYRWAKGFEFVRE